MQKQKNRTLWLVVVLIAISACIAGLFIAQHVSSKPVIDVSQFNGTLLDKPRKISSFTLMGVDGKPFNNASLRGQWTFMFFGFTHCSAVCPTTMAELGTMYRILEEQKVTPLPQVTMISLDPDRDSLDRLGQYVRAFDSHFYGARGDMDTVNAMTREMGIAYIRRSPNHVNKDADDVIEHTGAVMLFNPRGELVAFFTTPHQAKRMANDYMLLM